MTKHDTTEKNINAIYYNIDSAISLIILNLDYLVLGKCSEFHDK